MKGETVLAAVLTAAIALVVILVAFVWFPERAEPQQPPPPSIEQQVTKDATYTCTRSNHMTECVKGNITFIFEGARSTLYISFDGHETTVDCSIYLQKSDDDAQRALQSAVNRPREAHLLAGCKSL